MKESLSMRRLWAALLLVMAMTFGGLAAAGCSPAPSSSGAGASQSAASSQPMDASGASDGSAGAATYMVADGAGREVEIPTHGNLERMYATSPIGELYMITLAPELLCGSNTTYSEAELRYLPDVMGDLPSYGTWAMGGTLDNEALIEAGVQTILDVSSAAITDGDIDAADDLQDQTGIPVLLYDGSVDAISDTYRAVGEVLGKPERGAELADYCDTAYADVSAAVAGIPESERVSVYYAESADGLRTEPENSPHFTTFKVAGAQDVATVDVTRGQGLTEVSLENVIAWDPQVIIAWSGEYKGGADELIRTSGDWASIAAVRDGRVYTIPCLPFTWGDRPPSVTRYIGMQWLCNKLYPSYYDVDMVEVTKEYYKLFFSKDLTDDEARSILFLG